MYEKGHRGGVLIFWTVISVFLLLPQGLVAVSAVGYVLGFLLAMIPDKDQSVPGLPHRGGTHTIWFALLFGLVFYAIGTMMYPSFISIGVNLPPQYLFGIGVFIILVHLFMDALNPSGVRPYTPASEKRHAWGVVKSSSFFGNWLFYLLGLGIFGYGMYYFFIVS